MEGRNLERYRVACGEHNYECLSRVHPDCLSFHSSEIVTDIWLWGFYEIFQRETLQAERFLLYKV